MKAKRVNWLPGGSVLKIPGVPYRSKASSSAYTQKPAPTVFDRLQAKAVPARPVHARPPGNCQSKWA